MPRRLLIIGLLFCVCGAFSIWEVVWDAMQSDINVNFGVHMLPVGIGLLRVKESSRIWARIWLCILTLGGILTASAAIAYPENTEVSFFSWSVEGAAAAPLAVVLGVSLAGGSYYFFRQLGSQQMYSYFYEMDRTRIRAEMIARGAISE